MLRLYEFNLCCLNQARKIDDSIIFWNFIKYFIYANIIVCNLSWWESMAQRAGLIVKEAIITLTPGYPGLSSLFLLPAKLFLYVSIAGRKIRLFKNPRNHIPLMAGSILDKVAGDRPNVKMAARIVFGSASVLRCSENILKIIEQARLIQLIVRRKAYVVIQKKSWEELASSKRHSPSHVYFSKIAKAQNPFLTKLFFASILEILKSFSLLAIHFADACTAFQENNNVSEIFVHGRDIFDKLTGDPAALVKNLQQFERVSDMMLSKIGASWATAALIGVLALPAKARQKAPEVENLVNNFKSNTALMADRVMSGKELLSLSYLTFLERTNLLHKVPEKLVPTIDRRFTFGDPDSLRYIEPIICEKQVSKS
ncbi:hypothetical protein PHSC3_000603 [Chlamydiales bacterium STE3]|nr:hypothetical protein PHSC3_000603 [Chlamydiales bacterium STE3]